MDSDQTQPRRQWWYSLWFAVLAIVLAVGGVVLFLFAWATIDPT